MATSLFGKRSRKQTLSGATIPENEQLDASAVPYDQRPSRPPPAGAYSGHASITPPVHLITELIGPSEVHRTSSLVDEPLSPSSHSIRSSMSDGRERERRRRDQATSTSSAGYDARSIHSDAHSIRSVRTYEDPTATPRGSSYSDFAPQESRTRVMRPSTSTVSSRASSTLSSAPSTSSIASSTAPRPSRTSASAFFGIRTSTDDPSRPSRPSDAEVERLFGELVADRLDRSSASSINGSEPKRDVRRDMQKQSIEKKWELIQQAAKQANDGQLTGRRSTASSSSRTSSRPMTASASATPSLPMALAPPAVSYGRGDDRSGRPPPLDGKATDPKRDRPEDYLAMFMDNTISLKNLASLGVALRTYEVAWLASFISLQGQSVLSSALSKISRDPNPSESDILIEHEIIKCLKTLLNSKYGANDAIDHPNCITNIVYSITTPHLPTRKTVADILIFLTHWDAPRGRAYVLRGFDALQKLRNAHGRFDVWIQALEQTLDGRGRMGSMVGASEQVRSLRGKEAQDMLAAVGGSHNDSALNEYALSNLLLVNSIITMSEDFEVRHHIRAQLESAGLRRIMAKMRGYGHPLVDRQLKQYEESADADAAEMSEIMETKLLTDLTDPTAIVQALLESVVSLPRARDFFVSILQHLLLIREEGDDRVRYFGLIDRLVTAIVLDRKALETDFSSLLGASVAAVVGRFADQDRLQGALDETSTLKATVARLRREKEAAAEEASQQDEGIVGQLKQRLGRTEEDLRVSRQTTRAIETRMEELEQSHRTAMIEQDLQTRELFNMLKEARTLELIQDDTGILDRKTLMEQLEKKMQRTKTIYALEGRTLSTSSKPRPPSPSVPRANGRPPGLELPTTPQQKPRESHSPRKSRFEDAGDEAVRQHIELSIASGASYLSPFSDIGSPSSPRSPQSTRAASRKVSPSPTLMRQRLDSPSGEDSTPLALRSKHYPNLGPATPPTGVPGRMNGTGSGGKPSLPIGMMDELRNRSTQREGSPGLAKLDERDSYRTESGTSTATDDTGLTSIASSESPSRPAKSAKRAGSTPTTPSRNHTGDDDEDATISIAPPPPPPPPPPPFVPGSQTVSMPTAPDAPPAPPPPSVSAKGLLPSLPLGKSFVDMLKARGSELDTITVPAGSTIASPGSIVIPPPPPPPPGPPAPSIFQPPAARNVRKNVGVTANMQLKQLQWDNIMKVDIDKTVWADSAALDEKEVTSLLKADGVFAEMEEGFKAQQAKIDMEKKQKQKQLKSVLGPKNQQRVEIVLKKAPASADNEVGARVRDIASRLLQYDEVLCTETFIKEIKSIVPTPNDVGKLSVYRNAPDEKLAELHPADRFLVELIKVPRLQQRIDGMNYHATFYEQYDTLTSVTTRVIEACETLQSMTHFRNLLNLVLLFGNFMNANGTKGGAFGFRVSSINKLVDTKAADGTTLLQFLERTIHRKFPDMEAFLGEIENPASCSKLRLHDVRKDLEALQKDLKAISRELEENFSDLESLPADDGYAKIMWRFVREAGESLSSLGDKFSLATSSFASVLSYFGEDKTPWTTNEFFGVFQEFVTSYKKAKFDNARVAEEHAHRERRRQANDERNKREEEERAQMPADAQLVDDLLSKLRDGDLKGGRAARQAARKERQQDRGATATPTLGVSSADGLSPMTPTSFELEDPGDIARGLLQQLQGDGFEELIKAPASAPAGTSSFSRASRRRDYDSKHSSLASSREGSRPLSPTGEPMSRPMSPLAPPSSASAS